MNSPADGAEARDRDQRLHGQRTQTPHAEDKTGASSESAAGAVIATGTERFNVPGVLRMLKAEAAAVYIGERTKIELVARLIRQQQEEIERLTSVADAEMKLREGNFATIERLQRALAFWLPGVPADDPEVAQRAGDDAGLLAGYDGDEPSAEQRGWISLREAP